MPHNISIRKLATYRLVALLWRKFFEMYFLKTFCCAILSLVSVINAFSQIEAREYRIAPRALDRLTIDGKLDEAIWEDPGLNWSGDFVQRSPNEGQPSSEETRFAILYDQKYLYVGIHCFDRAGNVNQWMSRRDGYNGDWVEVILDSYHDKRSAFAFSVSASGVKSDRYISLNGAEEDIAWNPIWYTHSSLTAEGWSAEMKIPLSQLRFGKASGQVWGLQVQRRLVSNEERSVWQRIPQDAPGWVSEFGLLTGLTDLKQQRQLEIQPFVVGSHDTFQRDANNPYRNKHIAAINAGIDGKVGVTNDLTLDFTINPDFGQVEADPAAIALDGFQLFFREQRPFFIENKNIFDYRFSSPIIGSTYSSDNLFYSRRIGRTPQGSAAIVSGEYADIPGQTTILGAGKFSGKTQHGLSVGFLESVTQRTYARISDQTRERKALVEPLTNYFVGRVQQDLNNRNTFLGGIFTSVIRDKHASELLLHESAYSAGLDLLHQWKGRTWYVGMNMVASKVAGSAATILNTQRSVPHIFQRPDATHVRLDSARTALVGSGGDLKVGKAGNGRWQFESGLTWRSPQLELNDIGFMREADVIQQYTGTTFRSTNAFGQFRSAQIGYKHWWNWDFGGNLNYVDWDVEVTGTWKNNWSATLGFFSQPHNYSKSLLQGGPRLLLAEQYGFWWAGTSDTRKPFYLDYFGWTKTGGAGSYFLIENTLTATLQPVDRFKVSLTPRYTQVRHRLQYNQNIIEGNHIHYLVSLLDQTTLSMAVRADYVLGPNLAIQYYAEPFVSQGLYTGFALIDQPGDLFERNQLLELVTQAMPDSGTLRLTGEVGGSALQTEVPNPDFSFAQIRSNLVLRWEYRPGSELFAVWSQGITDSALPEYSFFRSFDEQILSRQLNNTFLIKATYRFHR